MRLWSLHPSLLDRAALVAGWRETLLAQKVLAGGTRGYTHHPQLRRFRAQPAPLEAIGAYLGALQQEATVRGYRFDVTRILHPTAIGSIPSIPVTTGQLAYELEHLRRKVEGRAPEWLPRLPEEGVTPRAHPLLQVGPGDVEDWEVR
ncbi:MAG: DNA lyase [Brachybacterium faecium]|nr:MAG: DNA lyase [Brachybacterium faecium]